jgi:hypothetical protein
MTVLHKMPLSQGGGSLSGQIPLKCHFTVTCSYVTSFVAMLKIKATCRQGGGHVRRDLQCMTQCYISGTATRLRLNNRGIGVRFPAEKTASRPTTLLPRVERPSHKPPSSVEVKNVWRHTPTPPYAFMVWCVIKHRDKCTFTGSLQ